MEFKPDPLLDAPPKRRLLGPIALALAVISFVGLGWMLYNFLSTASKPGKPTIKQITMVKLQTPPPPPKPPEKPPEPPPPKPKDEVKLDEPKPAVAPKPAEAAPEPAAAKLGIDAQGSGTGDGFGLGGNPGGRDLAPTTIGGTGTGTGNTTVTRAQYTFYRDVIVRHLTEVLGKIPELKDEDLAIPVLVWLDKSGRIERVEVQSTTMSNERVQLVRNTLLSGPVVRQSPPDNMPQPLRLKIRVQDAG
jgi:periplasmic protein TonB